jgi:hypothetical protein
MLFTALALAAASAFAFPFPGTPRGAGYFSAELKALESEYGSRALADVKVSDLIPVAGRLDVARQKDFYVMMAGGLSFGWPGAGQFLSGDWAGGTLHTGIHLGVTTASLAWAHSLLPADLRWGNLDYLNTKNDAIETAWKSHPVSEYFPAIGALAVGGVVDLALRFWSSKDAQATAKAQVDAEKVTFEPRFDGGHWGLGMRF